MDALIEKVRPYTKSSRARILSLIRSLNFLEKKGIEGDVVECGVWRGGNMILARVLAPGRTCWLYDTFRGMTKPTEVDVRRKDGFRALDIWGKPHWAECSVDHVKQNFLDWGLGLDNLKFVQGPVEETLLDVSNLPDRIALLRLDTDWYESTKVEMEVLYPKLVWSGVLIVDDYGHWEGARQAVDDYLGKKRMYLEPIDYTAVQMVKL